MEWMTNEYAGTGPIHCRSQLPINIKHNNQIECKYKLFNEDHMY